MNKTTGGLLAITIGVLLIYGGATGRLTKALGILVGKNVDTVDTVGSTGSKSKSQSPDGPTPTPQSFSPSKPVTGVLNNGQYGTVESGSL